MHIVLAPSWYPNDDKDLSGVFFRDQGIALQKAGYKVTVSYVETRSVQKLLRDKFSGRWKSGFEVNDATLREYRYRIYNFLLKIPFGREWLVYRKLNRLISIIEKNEGPIDLIHLHSFRSHGYGIAKICSRKKIPYVLTEHYSSIENGSLKPYQNKIIRKIGETASDMIAVGVGGASYLKELTGRDVRVIPNMVNVSQFSPAQNNKPGGQVIFSLGYLKFRKGFDLLIEAFSIIHSRFPEAELQIGGEGSERSNLESLIKKLEESDPSISGKIRLLGEVGRAELPEILSSADIFALTSRDEAFGVVLIEALAMGLPVVATSNAGPKRIVNSDCGVLVENENIQSIAEGLSRILAGLENYDSDKIRSYCMDNFSEEAVVSSLAGVYNAVLGDR